MIVRGATRGDAHAAEAAVLPADHNDNRHACRTRGQDRAHHFRHRDQPGIGFLQTHPAGLEQQQHRRRMIAHRAFQHADDLCAVHLAHRPAHEAAFLRGDEDLFPRDAALRR